MQQLVARPVLRSTALAASLMLAAAACTSAHDNGPTTSSVAAAEASCSQGEAPEFTATPAAFDSPTPVDPAGALSAQASEPTMSSAASPAKGYRIASVKVNARVLTNGVFAFHPESVVLADPEGHRCGRPSSNPLHRPLKAAQVDEKTSVSGELAFLVPAEANLSDYTVYYLASPTDSRAVAAWSGGGAAPSGGAQSTTCSSNKSAISTQGAKDHPFGSPFTSGDQQISLTLTPAAPQLKNLHPGPDQPNDVQGVVITVKADAKGSVGFVERNQFQLLDSSGNLCRYNELGSDGETLESDLVDKGKSRTYTLVFWTPRGSQVDGWKLLYMPDSTTRRATATWTSKPPAAPSATPTTGPSKK